MDIRKKWKDWLIRGQQQSQDINFMDVLVRNLMFNSVTKKMPAKTLAELKDIYHQIDNNGKYCVKIANNGKSNSRQLYLKLTNCLHILRALIRSSLQYVNITGKEINIFQSLQTTVCIIITQLIKWLVGMLRDITSACIKIIVCRYDITSTCVNTYCL